MTRIQALFFLLLPSAAVALTALVRAPDNRTRAHRGLGLLLGLGVLLGISSLLWIGRVDSFFGNLLDHVNPHKVRSFDAGPGFWDGMLFFAGSIGRTAGWPVALCALGCYPLLVRQRVRGHELLSLWVLGGMMLYSLTVSREPRYIMPLLPAVALLAALGLERLPRSLVRPLGALLLLLCCLPTLLLAAHKLDRPPWSGLFSTAYTRRVLPASPFCSTARQMVARLPAGARDRTVVLINRETKGLMLTAVEVAPLLDGRPWCVRGVTSRAYCQWAIQRSGAVAVVAVDEQLPLPVLWSGRNPAPRDPGELVMYLQQRPRQVDLVW
jgi:hypothetical protein